MELNGSGARYGFDESRILATMRALGFGTCAYDPFARRLADLGGRNPRSGNTLFVRDRPFVEQRLRTAAPVTVHGRRF